MIEIQQNEYMHDLSSQLGAHAKLSVPNEISCIYSYMSSPELNIVRFAVFPVVTMKNAVFLDVTLYGS
jgi:hypothetical protein